MDYKKWLTDRYPHKVVDAETAVGNVKSGDRVFIGTGCGEPQHLIKTMVQDTSIQDIMAYQMLSSTFAQFVNDESFLRRFFLKLFFISRDMRKAAFDGKIEYIPAYLSQIPSLFQNRYIGLDVALIQVSPPDRFGFCSLGVSVDITKAGAENAKTVIAQVNPRMPITFGNSFVHVDDIDFLVYYEEPLVIGLREAEDNEISRRIGHYVSQLIPDGATIQVGFGQLPNYILRYLENKNDLGLHTQLITDGMIPLFEQKIITNKRKTLLPGRAVASLCMGSEELYRYIHKNPHFDFRSSEFVNDPTVIARNDDLVSISSALEVDLTGQVCSDSVGYLFYSGIGDQVDFLRGSAMSRGGFSIIALPSTAQNGRVSRIVSHLSEGAGVATTRGDINFVVTEYGIAELHGKGIYQRTIELAQIAHPKFREELVEVAKKHHYIFPDQLPPAQEDLLFLEGYKSSIKLENGRIVEFRPLLPSDEFSYRNFFYSLKGETIYYRFFHKKRIFSHEMLQKQWSAVDYRKNMSLIGLVRGEKGRKEFMAIGSYAKGDNPDYAEVAFVVREDFQNMGITSVMLEKLERIAKENNYKGFSATVLADNAAMLHIFRKRYPNAECHAEANEVRVIMDFDRG
ncbi:MAG: GNAT family N-acetyltransferase [Thermodesulfobacteriota bacterium]|nr:GNAT family N-acetyltransferase [Thermodesulfobacteriota bacterium]